jgi:hypothetical protein
LLRFLGLFCGGVCCNDYAKAKTNTNKPPTECQRPSCRLYQI